MMKKILLLMFVMILLVGNVSAFEFDNVKSYDEETKTITIKNSLLGIGWLSYGQVAEIQLKTPLNYKVPRGYNKVAEFELRNFEDYTDAFKELELYDKKKGMEKFVRDYDYRVLGYEDVEKNNYIKVCQKGNNVTGNVTCSNEVNGTYIIQRKVWNELTLYNFNKDEVLTIGIFTEVKVEDNVEWIPNFFGVRIDEWAGWEESWNVNLISYWKLDRASGTVVDELGNNDGTNNGATRNVAGQINKSFDFEEGSSQYVNVGSNTIDYGDAPFSMNAWIKMEAVARNNPILGTSISNGYSFYITPNDEVGLTKVGVNGVNGDTTLLINQWYMVTLVYNGSNIAFYVNGTIDGIPAYSSTFTTGNDYYLGRHTSAYFDGIIDEVASWGRALTGTEVSDIFEAQKLHYINGSYTDVFTTPPTSTLNSPANDFVTFIPTVIFNATGTDNSAIQNMSLIINESYVITNSSPFNNTLTQFSYTLTNTGLWNWTVEVCDDENTCTNATYRNIIYSNDLTVSLNLPNNDDDFFTLTNSLNGTGSDDTDLINMTLYVNESLISTNTSVFNNTLTNFEHTAGTIGFFNWTIEACDDTGFCINATHRNFTISTNVNATLNQPINEFNSTSQTIIFNGTGSDDTSLANISFILNATYNGTNISVFNNTLTQFPRTLADGFYNWTIEVCDNLGFCINATARNFTIDSTLPFVDVTSPTGNQGTFLPGGNLTLNWTATDNNIDTCFYQYDGSNTSVTCDINTTNLTVTDSSKTSLIFWVNDTLGNENFDTTSWSYSFIENNITFNENVSETSSQFFEINLSTSLSVLSITAQLNYNGTNYVSNAKCNGNCIVNNTIDIPLVSTGENELKSFFWEINIFNGTDSININTSTQQQNVSRIHLETCGGIFLSESLNFTAFNERNLSRIDPYTFEGTFDIWLGGGDFKRNNSFSNPSITEKLLCISPNATYFTDAQIQYNEPGNITYITRDYYFQNNTISNVSQDIPLYLLESDSSTSFILKVQDDNLLPLEDYLIIIQRFYPGENIFRTVQIAKTGTNGKTIGFFETETVDYRFIIKKNDTTFLTTIPQKIVGEVAPFTITFTIGISLGKPWATLENLTSLDYSLIFNKSTNIITYTYIDTSGNFTLGNLIVERQNFSFATNTVLCNSNSSQSSATIVCNITGNGTGTYIAKGFITRGTIESLVIQINFIIESFSDVAGFLGVLLAWFMILISSFAFKFNEIAGIFMINAAVIFVNLIGLVSFGMLSISALVAVSVIIVVVMER